MLSKSNSELLTRVGKGSPLGEMMRRYWHPVALSSQVAQRNGAPLRTKLLGQRLVVFRDSDGRVGVLDEMCMHRGVSLALGRNEAGGLRCIYHGWKYAVDGTILETPNVADSRFREHKKAPAYPVREQAGLIWTYIGPPAYEPPFRTFEFDLVPEANRVVFRANTRASWLPLLEGGLDSAHVAILHTNQMRANWRTGASGEVSLEALQRGGEAWAQTAPSLEVEDTEFGIRYCAFRDLSASGSRSRNARIVPAFLPYHRIIPGKTRTVFVADVPMDDFETATYSVVYNKDHALDREEWAASFGYHSHLYNPETCWFELNWDDRLGQNRAAMATDWSGYSGIELEDFAMSVSIVEDYDRSSENLVASDRAIVQMRRRVLDTIRQFQEGAPPPGVNVDDFTRLSAYDVDIAADQDWRRVQGP